MAGVLLGFGGRYGPSVFHGLVFVAVGMLLANGLRRQSGRTVFYSLCGGLLALVGLTFWFLSWELPILNVLHEAVSDTWRQHNHVGYFALGVGLAVITLFALAVSMRKNKPLPAWSQFPLRFGTSSLAAFTVGNVLLNIRPRGIEIDTFPEALLYGLLFLGTTLLVLNLYSTFSLSSLKFRVSAWLPGRLRPSSRGRAHLNEKEEMGPLSPPPNLKPGAYKPE